MSRPSYPLAIKRMVGDYQVCTIRYWMEGPHLKTQVEVWNGDLLAKDGALLGSATSRRRLLKEAEKRHAIADADRIALDAELARLGSAVETDYATRTRQAKQADAAGQMDGMDGMDGMDAGDAPFPNHSIPLDEDTEEGASQATELVRLAQDWERFRSPEGDLFATLPTTEGQRATYRLKSKQARDQLSYRYWTKQQKTPRTQALQDALGVLAGKAQHEGKEHPVYVRLAEQAGTIYLDLGSASWEAVAIRATGWEILPSEQVPVKFRRPRGLLPLPRPIHGGSLDPLRRFLNVTDKTWILIVAWLVQACRPSGPYPVLALHGWQGSAKSTTARILRSLIDPSIAPLRKEPKEDRDLIIAATNSWCIALDNLSKIADWLSDALCRLSTGGGISSRELFTDNEEVILDAQRPVILTGIEELATRADLLDRALVCGLEAIPDEQRIPERTLWPRFEQARPAILGALLDAVAGALAREQLIRLERLPRMADFAIWATAAEPALGWEPGAFMRAYDENREEANDLALEAVLIVPYLRALVEEQKAWHGTMTDLLAALNDQAGEPFNKQQGWPKKPHVLSGMLTRIAPNLQAGGITYWTTRGPAPTRTRIAHLVYEGNSGGNERPSASTRESERPSERPSGVHEEQGSVHPTGPSVHQASIPTAPPPEEGTAYVDAVGAMDASFPFHSTPTPVGTSYTYITDAIGLADAVATLSAAPVIAFDTETTGLDAHRDRLRLLTLAVDGATYLIDTWRVAGWQEAIRPLFADAGKVVTAHNARFDVRFLLAAGIAVDATVHDTLVMAQLIDGGASYEVLADGSTGKRRSYALAAVVERALGQVLEKELQRSDWSRPDLSAEQLAYAARDAAVLLDPDIERVKVTAEQCPRISPTFLARERRRIGDWWYAQEYLCVFQEAETQAFTREEVQRAFREEIEVWAL